MAMACAFPVASSASAGLASSSTRCISTLSSQGSTRGSAGASTTARRALVVKCAQEKDVSEESRYTSRREVFSLAALSVLLLSADKAQAKDVPIFGFRKQLEKAEKAVEGAEKAVVKEVKELAKQGEKELKTVSASVKGAVSDIEAGVAVSPVLQAGGVAGAELVAVLVASTVVNGLVSVPSKDKRGKR
ncbi:unnamed protein product [Calypogeia fissa]